MMVYASGGEEDEEIIDDVWCVDLKEESEAAS